MLASILLAALPAVVHIQAASELVACDLEREIAVALERLLPELETSAGTSPQSDDLLLTVHKIKRRKEVVVRIRDASGTVRLERRLDLRADACAALADGIGLIVERFLIDIGWSSSTEGLEPPPHEEEPPVEPEPVEEGGLRLGLSAAVHGTVDGEAEGWFGPELGLFGRFERIIGELELGGNFWREDEVVFRGSRRGVVRQLSSYGLLGAGACWSVVGSLCVSGAMGVEQLYGWATGSRIDETKLQVVWQLLLRARILFVYEKTERIHPFVAIAATLRPQRGGFSIDRVDETYRTSIVGATLFLGLRTHFFRG